MDVVINAPGSGGYNAAGAELSTTDIGVMTGSPIPALGQDLSNDHPISIQYGGGGCSSGNLTCTSLGDADFFTPDTQVINGVNVWWVDTGTTGNGKQKTDMQLYTRTDITGGGGVQEPTVECGSCHDPHESEARPVSFMRISNDSSGVCKACHNK
jgi:predicted CXXCH cytochrome family protein